MDYLIIGGGASGMVSAINLSKKGYKVTIIEKNNSLGKKLLRTGSGRCNYFNDDFNETKSLALTFLFEILPTILSIS